MCVGTLGWTLWIFEIVKTLIKCYQNLFQRVIFIYFEKIMLNVPYVE